MKKLFFLIFVSFLMYSCNKKTLQLPEISYSNITDIKDVSAAYLFYDVTKPDSVEFNRKNLIGTTNWLVNIDKRLTLKQVLPHLIFLQNKRTKASMHKNEKAKNYFTCNDISIASLGFIDFTYVTYLYDASKGTNNLNKNSNYAIVKFTKDSVYVNGTRRENLMRYLSNFIAVPTRISLHFDSGLTFQDYVSFKSMLLEFNSVNLIIENQEFIY